MYYRKLLKHCSTQLYHHQIPLMKHRILLHHLYHLQQMLYLRIQNYFLELELQVNYSHLFHHHQL